MLVPDAYSSISFYPCMHVRGAPMINHCRMTIYLDISLMPCPNHVVINAPKRGILKVQVSIKLYFDVMTMQLVELISVAKVYLRTLVPRCPLMEVCDPPVQKDQRRGYRRLEVFSFWFDLSRR